MPAPVTVADLVDLYAKLHFPTLRQPQADQARIRRYFAQLLAVPLEAVDLKLILGWTNSIRAHSPTQADCCLRLLRCMFNRAIEWQLWTGANPVTVKRKRPRARGRYLEALEIPRLVHELEKEPVMIRLFFYIVLFCGCRPGEAQRMLIQDVKLFPEGGGTWYKPTTKNGQEHRIALPFEIPTLITRHLSVTPPEHVYLFQNRRTGKPLSYAYWFAEWEHIRRRANLDDVQLRDLRRTCATALLNSDQPLDLISLSKGVLNHTNLATTQVYAVPMIENVGRALDANMRKALASRPTQEVSHEVHDSRAHALDDLCARLDSRHADAARPSPGKHLRVRQ